MTLKRAVIAVGGNAILDSSKRGTAEEQWKNVRHTAAQLIVLRDRYEMVITHGNGPQVGNILIRNEAGGHRVPEMPLDVCVAQSQGEIGFMLQNALINELKLMNEYKPVVTIITQVVVDSSDPAFDNPTKFIGPTYSTEKAIALTQKHGWVLKEYSSEKFRRVVPSPIPLKIPERHSIRKLMEDDMLVVAVGGGGIPIVEDTEAGGMYIGVEAVVDKDLASAVLATEIEAEALIMLTYVDAVALEFGTPQQKFIDTMTITQANTYMDQGHFPTGSMKPKIKAAIQFLENGGKTVIITSPDKILDALEGKAGTRVVADL